jgi:hypothetical protein
MDIFGELRKDHQKVADLFKQIEKAEESGDESCESLFQELKKNLTVHSEFEETKFYSRLQDEKETEDIVREANEEHAIVKQLLDELDSMDVEDEQWSAKLTVLKENVEHHVKEEEGEMFKKAKKVLDDDEKESLLEEMMQFKEQNGISEEEEMATASSRTKTAAKKPQSRSKSTAKASTKKSSKRSA